VSKADTWMPLHIGDYLADTGHLRTIEHGAYFLLLMQYWRTGPLPDDDIRLASIARLSRREWAEAAPTIRAMFTPDNGVLRQKRADHERAKASELSDKRRQIAEARWGAKPKQNNSKSNAIAHAKAEQLNGICISPDRSRDLNLNLSTEISNTPIPPFGVQPQAAPSALGGAKPSVAKRTRYTPGEAPAFDEFWRRYPRKIEGPVTAKKAWDKAIENGAEPNEIIRGVARYPFDAKDGGKYIPQATTWLNQSRWTTQADTLPLAPVGPRKTTPTYGSPY